MNPSKQSTPSKGENERVSLPVTPQATGDESAKSASSSSVIESSVVSLNVSLPSVLLLTAVVHLMDRNGRPVRCRVFLDCGAQANLITTAMYERLGLEGFPVAINIVGVSNSRTKSSCAVTVNPESLYNDFHASLQCLVTPKITNVLPTRPVDPSRWNIPSGLQLADPRFHIPAEIDLLIGAGQFFSLLRTGHFVLGEGLPELRET